MMDYLGGCGCTILDRILAILDTGPRTAAQIRAELADLHPSRVMSVLRLAVGREIAVSRTGTRAVYSRRRVVELTPEAWAACGGDSARASAAILDMARIEAAASTDAEVVAVLWERGALPLRGTPEVTP